MSVKHRSPRNSRVWEDLHLRELYKLAQHGCELARWFRTHLYGELSPTELNAPEADVHHIMHFGKERWDLLSNLLVLSRPVHDWLHDHPQEGPIICLYRKYIKEELRFVEFRRASGKRLEGYLLMLEPKLEPVIKIRESLLNWAERVEP